MPAPPVGLREFAFFPLLPCRLMANASPRRSLPRSASSTRSRTRRRSSQPATTLPPQSSERPSTCGTNCAPDAEGRLKIIFRDETVLTLGEKASVVIDRYVYDPRKGVGEAVLQATRGAFRFATGRIKAMKQEQDRVSTPVADIGVRGTEFWGGPIDGPMGCCCSKVK